MRIGFIGLGAMGAPMAARLVAAGHDVHGFDVRSAPCRRSSRRAVAAPHPRAKPPRDAELLWLMVVNSDQAESVLFERRRARCRDCNGRGRRRDLHAGRRRGRNNWPRA